MTTDLAIREQPTNLALFAGQTPDDIIEAATNAANALKAVVTQQRLTQRIGTRDHVIIEGWQTLGALVGVFAVEEGAGVATLTWPDLRPLWDEPPPPGPEPRRADAAAWDAWRRIGDTYDAWQAHGTLLDAQAAGLSFGFVAAYHAVKDGQPIGYAEGRCVRTERLWVSRDDYALSSMAQTRGQSRALAAPLRWVVKLAGYEGTTAEDMAANGAPDPELDVVTVADPLLSLLDEEAEHDLVVALQTRWPGVDAHRFLPKLAKRLSLPGIPEASSLALASWAWWVDQPAASGNSRSSPPASDRQAPEPPGPDVAAPAQ